MSRESIGRSLDERLRPGRVDADVEGRRVEVDVLEVDRIGVRIGSVRVSGTRGTGIAEQAERLPDACRVLPDRIVPVEVAPGLGGAILRSHPRDVVDHEFFEVRTDGSEVRIERVRTSPEGREQVPFSLTREGLRRLVDDVGDAIEGR